MTIINPYMFASPPMLYINAGQSNDEKGALIATTDLALPYQVPFPEVQYYGTDGIFRTMVYSSDPSFQAPVDGTHAYANQFYLYPAIAAALGRTPTFPLYVCSYSVGDTDMYVDWNPTTPGTLYSTFVTRVNACKAALLAMYGVAPIVVFCLFDQGEKDGRDSTKATAYATHLPNFITNLRTAISEPNLKFIFPLLKLASINGSPNPVGLGSSINLAKITAAAADPTKVITQDTNYCEPSTDGVHFTAAGQLVKNTGSGGTVGGLRMSQIQRLIDSGWLPGTTSPAVPTDQTYFNGTSNYTRFGDVLDSIFTPSSGSFRIGITVWNPPPFGLRTLFAKFSGGAGFTNQRTFLASYSDTTIGITYYRLGTSAQARGITWTRPSVLFDGSEHQIEFRYDDTLGGGDDGLSRVSLYIDTVLYTTGKTLATTLGTLGNGLFSGTAFLAVGALIRSDGLRDNVNFIGGGWMKDFYVQNGAGTDQLRCPNLSTGTDTSGNGLDGTYV